MRMTTEPSTICKDGRLEGRRCGSWPALQAKPQKWKWGRPGTGDRPTVGHALVRQPRGEDEKIARSWDHHSCEVLKWDSDVPAPPARGFTLVLGRKAGTRRKPGQGPLHQPWKTKHGAITLDLSAAGRPWGRGKSRRWPRRTGGQTGGGRVGEGGSYGAGTSPAGALAPLWGALDLRVTKLYF